MITYKIDGLKELDEALKQLPMKLQQRYLRKSVAVGAKLIRDAVRLKAPIDTGKLKRNIIFVRSRRGSAPGRETYSIMVRTKKKKFADTKLNRRLNRVGRDYVVEGDAYYWKFIEFGTKNQPARPFMRQAFQQSQAAAIAAVQKELEAGLKYIIPEVRIK